MDPERAARAINRSPQTQLAAQVASANLAASTQQPSSSNSTSPSQGIGSLAIQTATGSPSYPVLGPVQNDGPQPRSNQSNQEFQTPQSGSPVIQTQPQPDVQTTAASPTNTPGTEEVDATNQANTSPETLPFHLPSVLVTGPQSLSPDQLQTVTHRLSGISGLQSQPPSGFTNPAAPTAPPPQTQQPLPAQSQQSLQQEAQPQQQQPTTQPQEVTQQSPTSVKSQSGTDTVAGSGLTPQPSANSLDDIVNQVIAKSTDAVFAEGRRLMSDYIVSTSFKEFLKYVVSQAFDEFLSDSTVVGNLLVTLINKPEIEALLDDRVTRCVSAYTTEQLPVLMASYVEQILQQARQSQVLPTPGDTGSQAQGSNHTRVSDWLSEQPQPSDRKAIAGPSHQTLPPVEADSVTIPTQKSKKKKSSKSKKTKKKDEPDSSDSSSSSNPSDDDDSGDSSSSSTSDTTTDTGSSSSSSGSEGSGVSDDPSDSSDSSDNASAQGSTKKSKKSRKKKKRSKQSKKEKKLRRRTRRGVRRALRQEKEDGLTPLKPVNSLFAVAVDYRTYRLEKRDPDYGEKAGSRLRKKQKDVTIDMQGVLFDGKDPVAIINFLKTFKDACDSNEVSEGIAKRMFQYYLRGTPRTSLRKAFKSRGRSKSQRKKDKKAHKVTTYPAIVQMLLKAYATDEVLSEAHASVTDYKKPLSMDPVTFAHKLSDRAERTGDVFLEESLREVFVMGIHESIRGYVRSHLSRHPGLSLLELARYAAHVSSMQGDKSTHAPQALQASGQAFGSSQTGNRQQRNRRGRTNPPSPAASANPTSPPQVQT